jgi:hypothetical protein
MPDACPIWSLRDLYEGVDSSALQTDIAACRKAALALRLIGRVRLPRFQGPNLLMSSPPMRRFLNS